MDSMSLQPELAERVRRRLAESGGPVTSARVAAVLREETRGVVGDADLLELLREAQSEFVGAGPLEQLLRDPATTDVLVNGPDEVWVDQGQGLTRVAVRFDDDAAVRRLAQRLASSAGRRLDDSRPWVDATLADGTRLHAVLPPIAEPTTCLSLRAFRARAFTLDELVDLGTLTDASAAVLRLVLDARLAFLITGGTGSGKTTLLASLLGCVDPGERIVLVEDAGELRPAHPHVLRLVARPPNVEDAGEVTLRDLVRQALRMRPDRVVVGEVRGAEVVDLLTALNTGHDGGCGTLHANGPDELPARLEALGALGGLTADALHSQLAAAVQVALHLVRDSAGQRGLAEVCVLDRPDGRVRPRIAWSRTNGVGAGAAELTRLLRSRGISPARIVEAGLPAGPAIGVPW
ncbi:MAG TPA: TadA family conjugal transfer-associated ATPase [Mycobacteriales bacterium]|nr:TadA family conjugal transfer-associated ATPase [Mycobacteriales bacterium]